MSETQVDEEKSQRAQRLAAALRANLHRRKQQARRRASPERDDPCDPKEGDSEETGSD